MQSILDNVEYAGLAASPFVTGDGYRLRQYRCGDAGSPGLIVVPPLGSPIVSSARLMRRLGRQFQVLGWEHRGVHDDDSVFFAFENSVARFGRDLHEFAVAHRCENAAVVAVCSGVAALFSAIAEHGLRPGAVVLVNPAVRVAGLPNTVFEETVAPFMARIASQGEMPARQFMAMANATKNKAISDPDLAVVTDADRYYLRSPGSVRIYAHITHMLTLRTFDAEIEQIRAPTLVIGTQDDSTVPAARVRRIAELISAAQLQLFATGGHHCAFLSAEFREAVAQFLESRPSTSGHDPG